MNVYSVLPLIALFSNLFLCFYILYINPKKRLNQIYSFITISLSVWSIAHFYLFNASSLIEANFWNNIGTTGAVFTAIFMFHFSLVFTKAKMSSLKWLILSFLYIISAGFTFLEFNTNLLTKNMTSTYWGYNETPGNLYILLSMYIIFLVTFSIIFCYRFLSKCTDKNKRNQTKFIMIGFMFPLVGGIITQVFFPLLGINFPPLTTILSTATVITIGLSIKKFKLMTPMSFSIQKKIVFSFFVFFFVLLFITLSSVNVISTNTMKESISNDLIAIVQSRANHIDTFLIDHKTEVETIANTYEIEGLLAHDKNLSEFNEKLNSTIDRLDRYLEINSEIIHISLLDSSGTIIASTNQQIIGENKKHSPLFINGKNDTNIKDIHYPCEGGNKPVFGVSAPVKNDNQTIGVVLVRFKIDDLYEITTDLTGLRETGEMYLLNRTGFIISPVRFFNESYNYNNIILKKKIDTINFHNGVSHEIQLDGEDGKIHDEMVIFKDYRGISVFGTHIYFPEMQWVLCCEIDESEILASINQMQTHLTIFLSGFSIIMLFFSWYFARNISKPIKKLDDYANEVKNGNLDIFADIKTGDEVGSLAHSFNLMTKSLKQNEESLEHEINKRTQDLQQKIDELQRFKKVTVGRELKMVELKNEIKQLKKNNQDGDYL